MRDLPTFVCICNNGVLPVALNPLAEEQVSISSASLSLSDHINVFPFNEPRLHLGRLLGLRIGAGRLEKHEDVVA